MTLLEELEGEVHQRLKQAVEDKRYADIERLNTFAIRLAKIHVQFENVQQQSAAIHAQIENLEQRSAEIQAQIEDMRQQLNGNPTDQASAEGTDKLELEISQSDINRRLLRVARLRDRNLIPRDGGSFTVAAVYADREVSFVTDVDEMQTLLAEREEIGRFFMMNGIRGGDRVLWERTGNRQFRISKI